MGLNKVPLVRESEIAFLCLVLELYAWYIGRSEGRDHIKLRAIYEEQRRQQFHMMIFSFTTPSVEVVSQTRCYVCDHS